MARQALIINNNKKKRTASLQKKKREILLATAKNVDLSFEERLKAQIKLTSLPRNGSLVRSRNRCLITGRPRGNFRKFGLSRNVIRELASWGQIPGLIKSSW